jgi:hypothetical protein
MTSLLPQSLDPWVSLENPIIKGMVKVTRKKPYLASEEAQETLFSTEYWGGHFEPQKRVHSPQLAAGLASVSENGKLPYGRRFPAACCRDLQ